LQSNSNEKPAGVQEQQEGASLSAQEVLHHKKRQESKGDDHEGIFYTFYFSLNLS